MWRLPQTARDSRAGDDRVAGFRVGAGCLSVSHEGCGGLGLGTAPVTAVLPRLVPPGSYFRGSSFPGSSFLGSSRRIQTAIVLRLPSNFAGRPTARLFL